MLIIFSVIGWVFNVSMLVITYFISKYFWVYLIGFAASVSITIFSSSSLCQNGCNFYTALFSSSITMAYANYFLATALIINPKDQNYLIIGLDVFLSLISLCYLAFVQPEKLKTNGRSELKHVEMKSFPQKGQKLEENQENSSENQESHENSKPNNTFFQFSLGSYCFYLGMILTNWEWAFNDNGHFITKCLQATLIMSFYLWSLIAPILLPDREFSR